MALVDEGPMASVVGLTVLLGPQLPVIVDNSVEVPGEIVALPLLLSPLFPLQLWELDHVKTLCFDRVDVVARVEGKRSAITLYHEKRKERRRCWALD